MQCAADISAALHRRRPAYAATLPHRYTNRPFGRQRTYTKRLKREMSRRASQQS